MVRLRIHCEGGANRTCWLILCAWEKKRSVVGVREGGFKEQVRKYLFFSFHFHHKILCGIGIVYFFKCLIEFLSASIWVWSFLCEIFNDKFSLFPGICYFMSLVKFIGILFFHNIPSCPLNI